MLILLSSLFIFNIQFPITELGSCTTMQECKIYCDNPVNQDVCIAWAENNGFRPKRPQEDEKHMKTGPGECSSKQECDAFCQKKENMDICLDFAVQDGFMTQEEADKMREFESRHEARKHEPKKRPKHREPEEPKINEEKVHELLETIGGPGGCATMDECDVFCSQRENDETCMAFAIEHELFEPGEAERMKKMMNMEGPGGCKGRECEDYCDKPENQITCMEFAREQGFMEEEEYQEAKKFMDATNGTGIGPGGCYGEECEAYCDDPVHQDECFEFFKKAGMIDPEEVRLIEDMKRREMDMEQMRKQEEMMHRSEEQNRIWQKIEHAEQNKEDEAVRGFYEKFPMNTEWTPEMEQKKDEYWQQVEKQRIIDQEKFEQEQREFEQHMREKEMREQEFKPDLSPLGLILYPILELLR